MIYDAEKLLINDNINFYKLDEKKNKEKIKGLINKDINTLVEN